MIAVFATAVLRRKPDRERDRKPHSPSLRDQRRLRPAARA